MVTTNVRGEQIKDSTVSLTVDVKDTLPIANGGTGATTAGGARTALGLVIGTDVQAADADLTTIAGLTATTDNFIVSVASAWASRTPSQVRTTLGLVIGTNVQAWDADLDTWATKTAPSGTVLGTTDTQTLTNKWVQPRVSTTSSASTVTPNLDTTDLHTITAQAAALTVANYTGTPVAGQRFMLRIKDNGTARAISWGTNYVSSGTGTLLATTAISKTHVATFMYDEVLTKLVCLAFDAVGY